MDLYSAAPGIFNTNQDSQFASEAFTKVLKDYDVSISMGGKDRAWGNIFVERLCRSVKYEETLYQTIPVYAGSQCRIDRVFPVMQHPETSSGARKHPTDEVHAVANQYRRKQD